MMIKSRENTTTAIGRNWRGTKSTRRWDTAQKQGNQFGQIPRPSGFAAEEMNPQSSGHNRIRAQEKIHGLTGLGSVCKLPSNPWLLQCTYAGQAKGILPKRELRGRKGRAESPALEKHHQRALVSPWGTCLRPQQGLRIQAHILRTTSAP